MVPHGKRGGSVVCHAGQADSVQCFRVSGFTFNVSSYAKTKKLKLLAARVSSHVGSAGVSCALQQRSPIVTGWLLEVLSG